MSFSGFRSRLTKRMSELRQNLPSFLSALALAVFFRWQDAEHGRPVTVAEVLCAIALIPILYWVIKHMADPSLPREERGIWIFLTVCLIALWAWLSSLFVGY